MNGGRNYKLDRCSYENKLGYVLETLSICHYVAKRDKVNSAGNQQERLSLMSNRDLSDETGNYLAGFVDGEGSFNVSIKKVNDRKLGWRVGACFNVSQRERHILELLPQTIGCGTIRRRWDGVHYFEVNSYQDLDEKVIPFFRKYQLRSPSKRETLVTFAKICEMMCVGQHLTSEGVREIVTLRDQMNNEVSKRHRTDKEILDSIHDWESSETIRQAHKDRT